MKSWLSRISSKKLQKKRSEKKAAPNEQDNAAYPQSNYNSKDLDVSAQVQEFDNYVTQRFSMGNDPLEYKSSATTAPKDESKEERRKSYGSIQRKPVATRRLSKTPQETKAPRRSVSSAVLSSEQKPYRQAAYEKSLPVLPPAPPQKSNDDASVSQAKAPELSCYNQTVVRRASKPSRQSTDEVPSLKPMYKRSSHNHSVSVLPTQPTPYKRSSYNQSVSVLPTQSTSTTYKQSSYNQSVSVLSTQPTQLSQPSRRSSSAALSSKSSSKSFGQPKAVARPKPSRKKKDVVIAVMGMTGAGKSSVISTLTGNDDVKVGHSLYSETSQITPYTFEYESTKYTLLDTPGFNDSHLTNAEVTSLILKYLEDSFRSSVRLSGIIYVHNITAPRLQGSAYANLKMFRSLCGEDELHNVVLATSFWDAVSPELGEKREKELIENQRFWANMVSKGARVVRLKQGCRESGLEILQSIQQKSEKDGNMSLLVQEEIVLQGKKIEDTSAGKDGQSVEAQALEKKLKDQKSELKKNVEKELKEADRNAQRQKTALQEKLDREAREQKEKQQREEQSYKSQLSSEKAARANEKRLIEEQLSNVKQSTYWNEQRLRGEIQQENQRKYQEKSQVESELANVKRDAEYWKSQANANDYSGSSYSYGGYGYNSSSYSSPYYSNGYSNGYSGGSYY